MPPQALDQEKSAPGDRPRCFVVMPFGKKPFPDGSGRTYDFDKVYEFLIRRAVRQAGMEPIRADEHVGSRLIHIDMFKDLRDQPVVLADLSLENPNVFYELGVRHVMSNTGTVLICNQDTVLPFDVQLSRVVFYEYDGKYLDWGVVERKAVELQRALQEAQNGNGKTRRTRTTSKPRLRSMNWISNTSSKPARSAAICISAISPTPTSNSCCSCACATRWNARTSKATSTRS